MLTSRDQVILTNHEPRPLYFRLDGRPYTVPAGASVHVPFDLVRINFGDPRSGESERIAMDGNDKVRIASRAAELGRLETLYGISGKVILAKEPVSLADEVPKVSVTTADGDELHTVVDDPGGEHAAPIPVNLDTSEAVASQVAQMQAQLDRLLERQKALEAQEAGVTGGPGADDVAEDTPTGSAGPK